MFMYVNYTNNYFTCWQHVLFKWRRWPKYITCYLLLLTSVKQGYEEFILNFVQSTVIAGMNDGDCCANIERTGTSRLIQQTRTIIVIFKINHIGFENSTCLPCLLIPLGNVQMHNMNIASSNSHIPNFVHDKDNEVSSLINDLFFSIYSKQRHYWTHFF